MDDSNYKSVLIVNDSTDALVTLYLYARYDPICWMSFQSKIILPREKYLHRSKKGFQFKLVARFEDKGSDKRPKKKLLEVQQWEEDKLFKITGTDSLAVTEGKLSHYPEEKRICLRKLQRDKELKSTSGRRNFYEILGLDMNKVRKMPKEEQDKAIKRGYYRQIRRWHPDNNGGDEEIAKEIIVAYELLQDEAKRAQYNNLTDYDGGWLSWKRYKAIFKPECVTDEQKKAYKKRMILFLMSALLTGAGIALTVSTAGLAAPLVVTGAVFGGGFIGGGLQSLQHTVNKHSVVDECSTKEWLMKAGFGFLGGAVTGGAAAGITAAVTGLGSAALESAAITAGQYIGVGAATGATGGVASSLAIDAARKFVDGENITWKQVVGHALCGGAIGAAAGVAGGAVTKTIVASQTSAASATLEGEVGEQILIVTGARRLGNTLARQVPRMLTENGTEAVMGGLSQFAEERLDDSVENRSPGEHLVEGLQKAATTGALGLARECSGAIASHATNEIKVQRRLKNDFKTPSIDDEPVTSGIKQNRRDRVRYELVKENNEDRHNWRDGKCSATYQPLVNETQPLIDNQQTSGTKQKRSGKVRFQLPKGNNEDRHNQKDVKWPTGYQMLNNEQTASSSSLPFNLGDEEEEEVEEDSASSKLEDHGTVKYISKGHWVSEMVVSFSLNGKRITEKVRGSGKSIDIPSCARNIEVKFQVCRLFWGDILKYDRFQKCWCKPDEPHVFRYDTPPNRTFTISGNLGWEAVMRVSDEYHEETKEM